MQTKNQSNSAFAILTSLFFMWGFITCMNDILIPHLKKAFSLTYGQAMLVQMAFFGAYFIISLLYFLISSSQGDPIAKVGYQKGLVLGLVICGAGCSLFYPAATQQSYGFFLGALFILASGITIIQIAANPYVAILGPKETASSRLNLAQGLNSLGYVIAPVIGGAVIFGSSLEGADSVKGPYLVLAVVFLALAGVFSLIKLPTFAAQDTGKSHVNVLSKYPFFKFGMIAIFCYVGAEVAVGSILVNYLGLPEVMGYNHETANKFLSFYWGGLMIGRFMGAISLSSIADRNKKWGYMALAAALGTFVIFFTSSHDWFTGEQKLAFSDILPYVAMVALSYGAFLVGQSRAGYMVGLFSAVIIVLLACTIFGQGDVAMWTIIGIGLFNSVMWSNIFTLSIDGLGDDTSQGSSLLVMMIVGGAVMPPLQGVLADSVGVKMSFLLIILCYVYLAYFGFSRARVSK